MNIVDKTEENQHGYREEIGAKKASDYTFNELQEMSSSQYSEYSYKWMDENTND